MESTRAPQSSDRLCCQHRTTGWRHPAASSCPTKASVRISRSYRIEGDYQRRILPPATVALSQRNHALVHPARDHPRDIFQRPVHLRLGCGEPCDLTFWARSAAARESTQSARTGRSPSVHTGMRKPCRWPSFHDDPLHFLRACFWACQPCPAPEHGTSSGGHDPRSGIDVALADRQCGDL